MTYAVNGLRQLTVGGIDSRLWVAITVLVGVLLALSIGRIVPGRFGYWLDLGLIMFACYLVGCTIGAWLRDRVVSRSQPAA